LIRNKLSRSALSYIALFFITFLYRYFQRNGHFSARINIILLVVGGVDMFFLPKMWRTKEKMLDIAVLDYQCIRMSPTQHLLTSCVGSNLLTLFENSDQSKKTLTFREIHKEPLVGARPRQNINQWFPTGVPRHTRVPWRGVRGASKYWIYYLFSAFTTKGAPNCHFSQVRVPPNFFSVLQGAVNQKRLKDTYLNDGPQNNFRLANFLIFSSVILYNWELNNFLTKKTEVNF